MTYFDEFGKKWADQGSIDPISDTQRSVGWDFLGSVPPISGQFNQVQQHTDEKINYLFNLINALVQSHGGRLTASGTNELRNVINQALSVLQGGHVGYLTKDELDADIGRSPGTIGEVLNDDLEINNGYYVWTGAIWEKARGSLESAIANVITKEDSLSQIIPLHHDAEYKSALWLEAGDLNARGVTQDFKSKVVGEYLTSTAGNVILPICHDANGNVPIWLEGGNLNARGVTDSFRQLVLNGGPSIVDTPVSTDGRSLYKLRAKMADRSLNLSQLKVGFTGDSWTEFTTIPEAMRDLLEIDTPRSGEGWISVSSLYKMNGVTVDRTGTWTQVDGGAISVASHPTGTDGQSYYTTTATATFTVANVKCTKFNIYYSSTNGAFRYRVDAGAWVEVAATTGFGAVKLTGLADTTHTIELDTTGNAGTLYILGFYATSDVPGVEIVKTGNASQRGNFMRSWIPNISQIAVDFNLDVLVTILGTNDHKNSDSTVEQYVLAMAELAAAYKAATPDIGLVFVIPAQSATAGVRPLSEYRDALYKFCSENGYEFFNLHDTFGTYSQSNALGQWVDMLHLNQRGATNFIRGINNSFFFS